MDSNQDYIPLVKEVQQGNLACRDQLANMVMGPLRAYVYRVTLRDDVTQDIVQETVIEMFKVLGKLEKADRFWPWLYGIAMNKVRRHYQTEKRRKTVTFAEMGDVEDHKWYDDNSQDGLANLVAQDLKKVILTAMKQLKIRHREVLTLRCYEGMDYSQIAKVMNCSEFGVRMLFFRAKKSLEKQLSKNGFHKGTLLTALVLFGKMTAPSKAAAAQIAITSSTTKVGLAASTTGMLTGKAALTTMAAVSVISATSIAIPHYTKNSYEMTTPAPINRTFSSSTVLPGQPTNEETEYWLFYPEGKTGSVMSRVVNNDGNKTYCKYLENDSHNFEYAAEKGTIYINNYHHWNDDLSVRRLPTDGPELTQFLCDNENIPPISNYISDNASGMLIILNGINKENSITSIHRNALEEHYFRYTWPSGARLIDNRDAIHRQGWGCFTITGQIDGLPVEGCGQIPFFYSISKENYPWIYLNIGDRVKLFDDNSVAYLQSENNTVKFYGGDLFQGFPRPWKGLHCIDTIRRDAAQTKTNFLLQTNKNHSISQITLKKSVGAITYTVDMDKDLVDSIHFHRYTPTGLSEVGQLIFTYSVDCEFYSDDYKSKLSQTENLKKTVRYQHGMSWMYDLLIESEK